MSKNEKEIDHATFTFLITLFFHGMYSSTISKCVIKLASSKYILISISTKNLSVIYVGYATTLYSLHMDMIKYIKLCSFGICKMNITFLLLCMQFSTILLLKHVTCFTDLPHESDETSSSFYIRQKFKFASLNVEFKRFRVYLLNCIQLY